jgi:hypothetical protein
VKGFNREDLVMKSIAVAFVVAVIFVLTIFGCDRGNDSESIFSIKPGGGKAGEEVSEAETLQSAEPVTQYVKIWGVWFYQNEQDIGKPPKDVSEKQYMEFGSKVSVFEKKDIEGKAYSRVMLPDRSEYWVAANTLVDKFIVITQTDVLCYKQPDNDYADTILLQPGDLGLFAREMDGWINAEFLTYRSVEPGGEIKRVGNKWIKGGYTEDLSTAKEAYYLNLAYYYIYSNEKDVDKAVERLEKASSINVMGDTEITYVINDLLEELIGGGEEPEENEGDVEIIFSERDDLE